MSKRERGSSLLGRSTRRAGAVVSLLVAAAMVVPTASAAPSVVPSDPGPVSSWSTTTGTDGRVYVADSQGRAMQFHGFNIKTDNPAADVTDELLAAAAERGLDHLRLTVFWDLLEPTQGTYDEAYLDEVVAAIQRAEDHGIYVILDMHQDVFGEAFDSHGVPAWATRTDGGAYVPQDVWFLNYMQPAVQNAWEHLYEDADLRQAQIDAWLHVVNRVKDMPGVFGYDLLNEPFGKIREGEDLLSAARRVESVQLTAMYQRLTDAISAADPDHWIFIEPPNLASLGIPTSLGEVHGPKVILYPHMYDTSIESATYTPGAEVQGFDPNFFESWSNAITTYTDRIHIPMMIGEWGLAHPDNPGMDEFVRRTLATLDKVSSGWSVFTWCAGSGYCPIDSSLADRPAIGQIFEPFAKAIAGAPTSSTYDFSSRVLRVRFTDNTATGPTQVYLPVSRAYPDGWTVETSDPAGSWSQQFDAATGVLSVTTARTGGAHAICVKPLGSAPGCTAVDPIVAAPSAPPAAPVQALPTFTG